MELFKGYASFGPHLASEGLPRIPEIRTGLVVIYEVGARNIYFEESANRSAAVLKSIRTAYSAQSEADKSLLRAGGLSTGRVAELKSALARYRASIARIGIARTRINTFKSDPALEVSQAFTVAEYEMVDNLPPDLHVEFDSESFDKKDLRKGKFLFDNWENFKTRTAQAILGGNAPAAVGLGRSESLALAQELRFRNIRIGDKWEQYRELAIKENIPTRLGSRIGLGHANVMTRVSLEEWVVEYDMDPGFRPSLKIPMACELDHKKVPTDEEIYPFLLEKIMEARFTKLDAGERDKGEFLQDLLLLCTSMDIKQLIRRIPHQGLVSAFDSFVQERI